MSSSTYLIIKRVAVVLFIVLILSGIIFIIIGLTSSTSKFDEAVYVASGIGLLFYSLFPLLTFLFLKQHHTKFLRYVLIALSIFLLTYFLLFSNRRNEAIKAEQEARESH